MCESNDSFFGIHKSVSGGASGEKNLHGCGVESAFPFAIQPPRRAVFLPWAMVVNPRLPGAVAKLAGVGESHGVTVLPVRARVLGSVGEVGFSEKGAVDRGGWVV